MFSLLQIALFSNRKLICGCWKIMFLPRQIYPNLTLWDFLIFTRWHGFGSPCWHVYHLGK